ncbi:MAG TPA: hypothetical protein VK644_05075, partial [Chitinophagaceae bacterium]|nr:hypothetical protein [Chitinophagaceae bacterium]
MGKTIVNKPSFSKNGNGEKTTAAPRLEVLKTYKIYINGQFPRTESGRYYSPAGLGSWKLPIDIYLICLQYLQSR